MADPLSISASVAGLVSLGLTVCSGILQYYGAWKGSEEYSPPYKNHLKPSPKYLP